MEDFDIDYIVLYDETYWNLMIKETWEIMEIPALLPSLGKVGLFKGKLITLCGRIKDMNLTIQGTSTKEEFKVVKFIDDSAPFPLLLGKSCIEKDQLKRKKVFLTARWLKVPVVQQQQ